MLAPVEVYASFSLISGRFICSSTACTALTVPDSVRTDPSASDSARTTWNISRSVGGRRKASPAASPAGPPARPPAGPPGGGALGADVCRPAPVVCCRRPPAPCGR
eukprot:scaffold71970_cov63-Phaeocystis_antarctica.AAC.1